MRNLLVVILPSLFFLTAHAQVQNNYGNEFWNFDKIDGIRAFQKGSDFLEINHLFAIRPDRTDPYWFLYDNPDSNSYSRMKYSVGSNANQYLLGDVFRPLSHNDFFKFDLERYSFPGWMTNSHGRKTSADLAIQLGRFKHYKVELDGQLGLFDKQYNGGLTNADYSVEQELGSNFNSLQSDVQSDKAFNRSVIGRGELKQYVQFTNSDSSRIYVESVTGYSSTRYRYFDPKTDLRDYQTPLFRMEGIETVQDSSTLSKFKETVFTGVTLDRSTYHLRLKTGVQLELFEFFSNDEVFTGSNQHFKFIHELMTDSRRFYSEVDFVFSGYNQGNMMVNGGFEQFWVNRQNDTVASDLMAKSKIEVNYRLNRPYLIYERYSYAFANIRNNLDHVSIFETQIENRVEGERLFFQFDLEYQVINGLAYFDSLFNVNQIASAIHIIAPSTSFGFVGDHLQYEGSVRYQFNDNSTDLSLPEWITNGMIKYRIPMFKQKIFISPGVDAWFFSSYYARGYRGLNDQYFVQSDRKYGDYLQVNPFIQADIRTVTIELKMNNVTYGLIEDNPMVGPYYPSIPRYLMFAVDWRFKN